MFKKGDKVIYIGDSDELEFGKTYTISKIIKIYDSFYIALMEIKNGKNIMVYSMIPFVTLKVYRKIKIDKLNGIGQTSI